MLSEIKRKIRKNKVLITILKVIHKELRKIMRYPKDKKDSRLILNKLSLISEERKRRVWYFCVAVHPNLGDQAQTFCIKRWLNNYYPGYEVVSIPTRPFNARTLEILSMLKTKIDASDLIVFQSGYCMTDDHPDEKVHRVIIESFPNNKIVLFPQTILFTNEKEKAITERIYNAHKSVILMARDKVSFETARKMFKKAQILLYPDIVTSLIGKYQYKKDRDGILFCMRNDGEQHYKKSQIKDLRENLANISKTDITDTSVNVSRNELTLNIQNILESTFDKFSNYKLVITDRYHGTIFSLISQTPVIVIDSTDHKLSSGVDWFKGVYDDYVYYARSLDEVYIVACKIIKKEFDHNVQAYFDKTYYQKLYSIVEKGAV